MLVLEQIPWWKDPVHAARSQCWCRLEPMLGTILDSPMPSTNAQCYLGFPLHPVPMPGVVFFSPCSEN